MLKIRIFFTIALLTLSISKGEAQIRANSFYFYQVVANDTNRPGGWQASTTAGMRILFHVFGQGGVRIINLRNVHIGVPIVGFNGVRYQRYSNHFLTQKAAQCANEAYDLTADHFIGSGRWLSASDREISQYFITQFSELFSLAVPGCRFSFVEINKVPVTKAKYY